MIKCRLCKGSTVKFLDLGKTPTPEEFRTKSQLKNPIKTFPLNLVTCKKCRHVQLGFTIPQDFIYQKNYFYDYSLTQTGLQHFAKLATGLYKKYDLNKNDLVIDIGSNTGLLLSIFKDCGIKVLGIDPSKKHAEIAINNGIPTISDYFSKSAAQKILKTHGQIKIITCTNVFDHVDSLEEFMTGVNLLLKDDGVLIIEVPYFLEMVQNLSHTVYHQQIDYMMLTPLIPFFKKFGFEIADAERIKIHGGSIRIYLKGSSRKTPKLTRLLKEEKNYYKDWINNLNLFSKKVIKQRDEFANLIRKLKKLGAKIGAVGASAKGINLLNYSGLDKNQIDFISEKSELKIGLYTPSGIPIISDLEISKYKPDFLIMLSWNFKKEIIQNLDNLIDLSQKFILPLPKLRMF